MCLGFGSFVQVSAEEKKCNLFVVSQAMSDMLQRKAMVCFKLGWTVADFGMVFQP